MADFDLADVHCRTCAAMNPMPTCVKFDSPEAKRENIIEKLEILGLSIKPDDMLPKFVCRPCFNKIKPASIFVKAMQTAQRKLMDIFNIVLPNTICSTSEEAAVPVIKQELYTVDIDIDMENSQGQNEETTKRSRRTRKTSPAPIVKFSDDDDNHSLGFQSDTSSDSKPLKLLVKHVKRKTKLKVKKDKKIEKVKRKYTKRKGRSVSPEQKEKTVKPKYRTRKPKNVDPKSDDSAIKAREAILYADQTWKEYTWECGDCGDKFDDMNLLRQHCISEHKHCCTFKCIDCIIPRQPFLKIEHFIAHVTRHRPCLRMSCFYCNAQFETPAQYVAHKQEMHKVLVCHVCGDTFESELVLQQHIRELTIRIGEKKCTMCDKMLKIGKAYTEHLKSHSERAKEAFCDICGRGFYSVSQMNNHREVHTTVKLYQCTICNTKLKTKMSLYSHLRVHEDKQLACDVCGKTFKDKYKLRNHMAVHSEAIFGCSYCEKSFTRKRNLEMHVRQHTGEKPYCCEKCNRNFTNLSNYRKHLKKRHGEGSKPRQNQQVMQPSSTMHMQDNYQLLTNVPTNLVHKPDNYQLVSPLQQRSPLHKSDTFPLLFSNPANLAQKVEHFQMLANNPLSLIHKTEDKYNYNS